MVSHTHYAKFDLTAFQKSFIIMVAEEDLESLAHRAEIPYETLKSFHRYNPKDTFLTTFAAERIIREYSCKTFTEFDEKAALKAAQVPPATPPIATPEAEGNSLSDPNPEVEKQPEYKKIPPVQIAPMYSKPFGKTVKRILELEHSTPGKLALALHYLQHRLRKEDSIDLSIDLSAHNVKHYLQSEKDNAYGHALEKLIYAYYKVRNIDELKQFADALEQKSISGEQNNPVTSIPTIEPPLEMNEAMPATEPLRPISYYVDRALFFQGSNRKKLGEALIQKYPLRFPALQFSFNNYLKEEKPTELHRCIRDSIFEHFGVHSLEEFAAYTEKLEQENFPHYDVDSARLSILYLMEEKGLSLIELGNLTSINSKTIGRFLNYGIGMSPGSVLKVANTLGADSWNDLYARGEQIAQNNPFDAARVQKAIKILMAKRGWNQSELAANAEVDRARLNFFLTHGEHVSHDLLKKVARALGANGWGELYRMAGTPLAVPDNGVSRIVSSLMDEVMNTPVKTILEKRAHEGQLQSVALQEQPTR